ncbi:MAG TPA: LppX_LprAFG lipoprotein, partial [Dehalococcoidia bacterium]|nr:LppX_LprAFG lipoprotein [Dehalococcoidia bacterium]
RTFHFVFTNEQGTTSLPDGLTFSAATGDVERPDRFEAKVQTKLKLIPITVTIVGVGSKVYYQNPITHHFHEISSSTAALALLNPAPLLVAAISQIQRPVISGTEQVNNVATTRVDGLLDIPATGPGTPSALPFDTGGKPLPLSIWIDATGHTVQLRLTGPLRAGDSNSVVRQLDLSQFNETVNIQAPNQ